MIDISERLKRAPKGFKLYSLIHGEVTLIGVDKDESIVLNATTDDGHLYTAVFDKFGRYHKKFSDGECLLFPSKGDRDWSKFYYLDKFSKVMVSRDGSNWCLKRYLSAGIACDINNDTPVEWRYIVPVEDFNFNAVSIESNCSKSII